MVDGSAFLADDVVLYHRVFGADGHEDLVDRVMIDVPAGAALKRDFQGFPQEGAHVPLLHRALQALLSFFPELHFPLDALKFGVCLAVDEAEEAKGFALGLFSLSQFDLEGGNEPFVPDAGHGVQKPFPVPAP